MRLSRTQAINWNRLEDPKDLEIWNRSFNNFWVPEKIALSNDLPSWNKMTESERELTVRVFTGLTLLDTIQSHTGVPTVAQYARTLHEEAVYSNFTFMEAVHAKSYSSIFSTLCSTRQIDEAFTWSESHPSLQRKATLVLDAYQSGDQFKVMIASTLLESFLFYSGFYLPLYWSSQAKLTNTADLIKLILRDECLTDDHELLTPSGWKNISLITKDDKVAQFDNEDGSITFVHPTRLSQHDTDYTWEFRSEQGHVRQSVSPGHRMYLKNRTVRGFEDEVVRADDMKPHHFNAYRYYLNAGNAAVEGDDLSIIDRLLIAIQADGHFDTTTKNRHGEISRNGSRSGFVPCNFSLSKERKIVRLKELAALAEWTLVDRGIDKGNGNIKPRHHFQLMVPKDINRSRRLADIRSLDTVSYSWATAFIDELAEWDGYRVAGSQRITWGSVIKENVDYVQAVAALAGYRTHYACRVDTRSEHFSDYHRLQIARHIDSTNAQCVNRTKGPGRTVYGVEVPTTFLLTRNHGSVTITGNCIHGFYIGYKFQQSFNELSSERQDEVRLWCTEFLFELYDNEVEYTESLYDTIGQTEDVKAFLHYNANRALMNLGFDPLFSKDLCQVSPAILSSLSPGGDENHDFFSGSGSSYVIGKTEATEDDDWAF